MDKCSGVDCNDFSHSNNLSSTSNCEAHEVHTQSTYVSKVILFLGILCMHAASVCTARPLVLMANVGSRDASEFIFFSQ